MKIEIHIVTCLKDIVYMEWGLKSIAKFATGFSGVTLVLDATEQKSFEPLKAIVPFKVVTSKVIGQLGAQMHKCMADRHCPTADYILHTDSDCIFTEPVTPDDYFYGAKPVMLIEPYEKISAHIPWRKSTEKALGFSCPFETMRRHPQVNPIGVYHDMRQRISLINDCQFEHYVMAQKPDYPQGFSEHNVIGSFALDTPEWRCRYHWIDISEEPAPAPKLKQFWSHSPPDAPHDLPDGSYGCPLDYFKKLGL